LIWSVAVEGREEEEEGSVREREGRVEVEPPLRPK
jgi:hypothetical protein